MAQGIRAFCNAKFQELLPKLQAGEWSQTQFRAEVMNEVMAHFQTLNVNAAATHYNHSLKMARINAPRTVEGLGRSEDKKGGRKLEHPVTVIKVRTGEVVAEGISRTKADTMIRTAEARKRAKLAIQEHLPLEPVQEVQQEVATPVEAA